MKKFDVFSKKLEEGQALRVIADSPQDAVDRLLQASCCPLLPLGEPKQEERDNKIVSRFLLQNGWQVFVKPVE